MFELLSCPALLDVMEQLCGSEVIAAGIYRLRPKLPKRPEGIVPFHQDAGYFGQCADAHVGPRPGKGGPGYVMTAWVPLMEASLDTGPMAVLPRAHNGGVLRHYGANVKAPGLCVHPEHFPPGVAPITVPCSVGDALLFPHMTPHRSEANDSSVIRWGADLRYAPPEAGDWGPSEGGFLARSASPDRQPEIMRDWRAFVRMRREHTADPNAPPHGRAWLGWDKESFASPNRRQLERIEEYEGRLAARL